MSAALLAAAAIGAGGCVPSGDARREEAPAAPREVAWPPPPAPARLVLRAVLRTSADLEREGDTDRLRGLLGGGDSRAVGFDKPYGLAAGEGILYVSDTVARAIHAFDFARRRYFRFGYRLEGRLTKPLGMSVDAAGRVYVADAGARQVVVFDRLGLFLRRIGSPRDLDRPADVAVDSVRGRVYVVDLGGVGGRRHRVVVYDPEGRRLGHIGTRGREPGRFNLPVAAAVGPDGTLYVLDAGNFRVQAFGPDGAFRRQWGSIGTGFGQFARPKDIAVDREGLVYVADAAFGNVQIFDPAGRLLLPVGRVSRVDGPGVYALLTGVAAGPAGFVYLLDQVFRKVEVLRRVDPDERGSPA